METTLNPELNQLIATIPIKAMRSVIHQLFIDHQKVLTTIGHRIQPLDRQQLDDLHGLLQLLDLLE